MMIARTRRWWFVLFASLATMFPASWLAGQAPQSPAVGGGRQPAPPSILGDLDKLPGMADFVGGAVEGDGEVKFAGSLRVNRGQRTGVIQVRTVLAPSWHIYATDQEGGPGPAKITLPTTDQIRLSGEFRPDKEPQVRKVEYFDTPLREHYGEVTWSAPVELSAGVNPEKLKLELQFDGQICNDEVGCKPLFGKKIEVVFSGFEGSLAAPAPETKLGAPAAESSAPVAESPTGVFRAERSRLALQGQVTPATTPPGGKFQLAITASLDPTWHVYAYAPRDPQAVAKPTLIVVTEPAAWPRGPVLASQDPIVTLPDGDQPPVRYHEKAVTWTVEFTVPADAAAGEHTLAGIVGYQTCTDTSCDRPLAARFTARVTVGQAADSGPVPLAFTADRYAEAAQLAAAGSEAPPPPADSAPPAIAAPAGPAPEPPIAGAAPPSPPPSPPASLNSQTPLHQVLLWAFLGGLILNIMPCVLPVIGLKVMAFVQQAGESRAQVLALNVWYALGLISVFLVLATLLVVWNVGWGEQFSSEVLTITLAAVVFAMGLSFLGVWQMPIPGFAVSDRATELTEKEGPAGAFAKGIITTILATPCSGPGVAIALGYCQGKPASVVYMIFAMVGLGMASPYLMIGVFPQLLRLLPRPGAWMETFERLMGLVLLGTVIYLLSFTAWANVLPAVALLLGVGAACWWIGRIPITAEFPARLRGWLGGIAVIGLSALLAFTNQTTIGGNEVYGLRGIMEHRLDKYIQQQAALHSGGDDILNSSEITQHTTTIRWLPYSERRLERLIGDNRTVLVDFTADWCLTCKTLEATVLNTQEVRDLLRANGVVTLQADWTDGDAEIGRKLESLGSKQVPVVAIFPAGGAQPIVLMGFYTKAALLEKVREAGPSDNVRVAAARR